MKAYVRNGNDIVLVDWHVEERSLLGVTAKVPVIDGYVRLCRRKSIRILNRLIEDTKRESYIPFCKHDRSEGRHGAVTACQHGCRPQHGDFIQFRREIAKKVRQLT